MHFFIKSGFPIVAGICLAFAHSFAGRKEIPSFTPHFFQDSTPETSPFRESLTPVDLDGDGDLDFFTGNGLGGKEWWFENKGDGDFRPHLVSDSNDADVGAAILDIDGDGDIDRLAGGFLYINPGDIGKNAFEAAKTGAPGFTHDLLVADFDGDGKPDFVTIKYDGIWWYRNPGPPFQDWPKTDIAGFDTLVSQHGGLAVGDFDGDGDPDVFRVNCWFENTDKGKTWIRRPGPDFGQDDPRFYGLSARTAVADFDGDGDLDLAQAECDIGNGRVAWFENRERGGQWIPHLVKDSTDGQDFHSFSLADFDGDGDPDFFSCGGSGSRGPKNWYIWENLDGKGGSFKEHIIWKDAARPGHEAIACDLDGDADMDILGKQFSGFHHWLENGRISGAGILVPVGNRNSKGNIYFRKWEGLGTPLFLPGNGASAPVDGRGRVIREVR